MDLAEIITSVQTQFGDKAEAQITASDITRWANNALVEIVRKTECLQKKTSLNVVAAQEAYPVGADFLKIRRVAYNNRKLSEITLEELDGLDSRRSSTTKATPSYFYIWDGKVNLYPLPDENLTGGLTILYVKLPAALVNSTDVPEIPVYLHEDIIRYALARAKEVDEEDEKAAYLLNEFENRMLESRYSTQESGLESYGAVRCIPGDLGWD